MSVTQDEEDKVFSTKVWKKGENPRLFAKGTPIIFMRDLDVVDSYIEGTPTKPILRGATGTVVSVFPCCVITVDEGDKNPHRLNEIVVRFQELNEGIAPVREDGRPALRVITSPE